MILNLLAGLVAGILTACGGSYKDAPYEGFHLLTFFRSPIVGLFCGWISWFIVPLNIESYKVLVGQPFWNFVITVCICGYMERLIVEGWKMVRHKKPGKFDVGEWGVAKILKGDK